MEMDLLQFRRNGAKRGGMGELLIRRHYGRLPDNYSRVEVAGNLIMAEIMDPETYESHACLVNTKGEILIPYEDNQKSINITDDGSLVPARDQDWNYQMAVFPQ